MDMTRCSIGLPAGLIDISIGTAVRSTGRGVDHVSTSTQVGRYSSYIHRRPSSSILRRSSLAGHSKALDRRWVRRSPPPSSAFSWSPNTARQTHRTSPSSILRNLWRSHSSTTTPHSSLRNYSTRARLKIIMFLQSPNPTPLSLDPRIRTRRTRPVSQLRNRCMSASISS